VIGLRRDKRFPPNRALVHDGPASPGRGTAPGRWADRDQMRLGARCADQGHRATFRFRRFTEKREARSSPACSESKLLAFSALATSPLSPEPSTERAPSRASRPVALPGHGERGILDRSTSCDLPRPRRRPHANVDV
jgi:hypothetical protein